VETSYKGTNKMITGIVFGVITFWLFAQAIVNVVPAVQEDLGISLGTLNVAISLAALFSGLFIVAAGGLADKVGRKKIAVIGFILSIIGSLCLVLAQGAALLIIGRIIQGVSAACIMPSTIALIKAYFEGADRQRAAGRRPAGRTAQPAPRHGGIRPWLSWPAGRRLGPTGAAGTGSPSPAGGTRNRRGRPGARSRGSGPRPGPGTRRPSRTPPELRRPRPCESDRQL